MAAGIQILHVDDEPGFADMTREFLTRRDDRFSVHTATSPSEGLSYLRENRVDCVISDHDMPGKNGIEFLEAVREQRPNLPFILFTGKGSEAVASEAISAGVTDYLQKEDGTSQYAVLANRIVNAVEQTRVRRQVEATEEKLTQLAGKTDDILYMFDADWSEVLFVNSAFEDIWGLSTSELEADATAFLKRVHPADRPDVQRALERVSDGEAVEIEYRVQRPDDDQRWVRADSKPILDDGGVERIIGFVRDITEQKTHERELREERAFVDQTLDALDDVFFVFDTDFQMRRWNEQVVNVTGYPDDAVAEMEPVEFVPDEQRCRIRNAIEEMMETGTATVQADLLTNAGERQPYEFVITRLVDDDGAELGFAGVGRDISGKNARKAELERAHDLLEQAERIADVGGWEIDAESSAVFWTEHLFDILGVDRDEEPPLDEALDVYHEDDRKLVEDAISRARERQEQFDVTVRFRRPDGEVGWLRIQGMPAVEDGEVVSLRGAVQDVTEQRQREQELEQARQDYEALFNGMNDMAWVIDTDGEFVAANDAAVEETGYSRAELLSMSPSDIDAAHEESEVMTLINRLPDHGTQVFETVHETSDGREIPVEISSSLVSYRGERAALSIARDITDRKHREEQLEQFASVVSHDLRNPLTVAKGRLELARADGDSEHVEEAIESLGRMDRLIEDVLTLARQGEAARDREPVALDSLAEEAWRHVASADAELQVETSQRVLADRSRLQQLTENLLANATEHGGTGVTITVGDLDDGFYVEDDGSGVPDGDHEDIFEAGYSASPDGTGFGLSIVEQIADGHDWRIEATDGSDGGARFEITEVESDT
ncbi:MULTISPECIES: PAS domain S-box protein [Halobacterium]|uniref:PAS domain S-box protein n=1 Tax=Halobacterium TaxID=2239 RepID=UPI00073F62FF|nr:MULTISPECIES: PAS domain S-box protein [Halobacterium]MCG1003158.1 PAS domain S-box protein [Halobacterium noricense]